MSRSEVFALQRSGLNDFLFAPIGTERNGMTLTPASAFARLGEDPWREAGRLARLPKPAAIDSLARTLTGMPASVWPLAVATPIAARLIALLPAPCKAEQVVSMSTAQVVRAGKLGLVVVAITFAAAYMAGAFTTEPARQSDSSDVATFTQSDAIPPSSTNPSRSR
jgi:hypothetical protein